MRWAIGLFFGILLVLTFLSNTIQSLTLPKVAVEKPSLGSLDLSVTEDGYLQPAYLAPLTPLGSWKVDRIHVDKGDRVRKGDPLITFDTTATERSLEDERTRYEQERIRLEQSEAQLKPLWREGGQDEAIDKLQKDLQVQKLDMDIARRKIADLEKLLRDGRVLRAPVDGVVSSLTVEEGANAGAGQPVGEIASDASGYQLVISASGDAADALRIGAEVTVEVNDADMPQGADDAGIKFDGMGVKQLTGTISSIEAASGGSGGDAGSDAKRVTIDVDGTGLSPGLKASVYIPQESRGPGFKIPADALHSDDSGTYVFVVSTKEGPLGTSYYAEKAYVDAGEQNDDTVVVMNGLTPEERVVTDSSEPLSDGDRVRLE